MIGLYSVLLAVIMCGTVSAAEDSKYPEETSSLSIVCNGGQLGALYASLVKSRGEALSNEMTIKEVMLEYSDESKPKHSTEEVDGKLLSFLLRSGLICGEDVFSEEAVQKLRNSLRCHLNPADGKLHKIMIGVLGDLRLGNEDSVKKKYVTYNSGDKLGKALHISLLVRNKFPQNLPGAFEFIKKLKSQFLKREDKEKGDEPDDEDKFRYIEFEDGDCELILPMLGAFIGAKKLAKQGQFSGMSDDELANLAGVESQDKLKFNANLQKYRQDIILKDNDAPPQEIKKLFINNLFSGKYINIKTVAVLMVALGCLYWWYK